MLKAVFRHVGVRCASRRPDIVAHAAVLRWAMGQDMTERSLRRAFHKVAREVHPDVVGAGGGEMMTKVNESFKYLAEVVRRSGGRIPGKVFEEDCHEDVAGVDLNGTSEGEMCVAEFKKKLHAATTVEEMKDIHATLWESIISGHIDNDTNLLKEVVKHWATVLPFGQEHTYTILAVMEKWSTLLDAEVPLDLIHDILEGYSDSFVTGHLEGSSMSKCWPLILEFLQAHCEPTEYTFLVLRRMDPTIRI